MDDRYVAGLFDGEGYVRIIRWEKPNSTHIRYALASGINMCFYPVIKMLHDEFGGSLSLHRHDLRNSNHRVMFGWTVGSQVSATFLRRILPFSVVKRDEILIALQFQDHIDSTPYSSRGRRGERRENSEAILAFREDLFQKITALKKRSFPPLLDIGPKVSGAKRSRHQTR